MTKIARGYTRLSGSDSERSIPTQKRKIKQYCSERDDIVFDKIYNEGKNQSGWDDTREQYQKMIQDAKNNEFDVLVVRIGSRIGRDKQERLDLYFDLANKYDVEFHTVKRGYVDPENPTDLLLEVFEASKDDEKKEEIRRSKMSIKKRQDEGYWQGRAPFGLKHSDTDPPGLTVKDEFQYVLRAYEMLDDDMTYQKVVDDLDTDISLYTIHQFTKKDRKNIYKKVAKQNGIEFDY